MPASSCRHHVKAAFDLWHSLKFYLIENDCCVLETLNGYQLVRGNWILNIIGGSRSRNTSDASSSSRPLFSVR